MLVKIGEHRVDVVDQQCAKRKCFQLGFDKGSFVQGVGYTFYHAKERAVCMQRFLHGCPTPSICPECRTLQISDVLFCAKCSCPVVPWEHE